MRSTTQAPASSAEFLRAATALLVRRRAATVRELDATSADCQAVAPGARDPGGQESFRSAQVRSSASSAGNDSSPRTAGQASSGTRGIASLRGWRASWRGIVNRPSLRFGLVLMRCVARGAAPGGRCQEPPSTTCRVLDRRKLGGSRHRHRNDCNPLTVHSFRAGRGRRRSRRRGSRSAPVPLRGTRP